MSKRMTALAKYEYGRAFAYLVSFLNKPQLIRLLDRCNVAVRGSWPKYRIVRHAKQTPPETALAVFATLSEKDLAQINLKLAIPESGALAKTSARERESRQQTVRRLFQTAVRLLREQGSLRPFGDSWLPGFEEYPALLEWALDFCTYHRCDPDEVTLGARANNEEHRFVDDVATTINLMADVYPYHEDESFLDVHQCRAADLSPEKSGYILEFCEPWSWRHGMLYARSADDFDFCWFWQAAEPAVGTGTSVSFTVRPHPSRPMSLAEQTKFVEIVIYDMGEDYGEHEFCVRSSRTQDSLSITIDPEDCRMFGTTALAVGDEIAFRRGVFSCDGIVVAVDERKNQAIVNDGETTQPVDFADIRVIFLEPEEMARRDKLAAAQHSRRGTAAHVPQMADGSSCNCFASITRATLNPAYKPPVQLIEISPAEASSFRRMARTDIDESDSDEYEELQEWEEPDVEKVRKAAEQGNPDAQYNLGYIYDGGEGVAKDAKQAVCWFRKAAEQGNAGAQNNLGCMYDRGNGVARDLKQAVFWYRKAAKQGDPRAQYNLGCMYDRGDGVAKDTQQAVFWYRKAVEQGDAGAQKNLGWMYERGEGVAKDAEQAVFWYRKAAEQGDAGAQHNLGGMYDRGDGVARDAEQAVFWFRKAAEQGDAGAQFQLGEMYTEGSGVPKDMRRASMWFRQAANQGDSHIQFHLGYKYAHGFGVPKNLKLAMKWYRSAADQGDAHAQTDLGSMYLQGLGVRKDEKLAAMWFRKAADQDYVDAQWRLGEMYANGRGVRKDDKLAVMWYRKAADQGLFAAQYCLAVMYASGRGVRKDEKLAAECYRKAADQGYADAECKLGCAYAEGAGVPKDLVTACVWLSRAVANGSNDAKAYRDHIEKSMTRHQVAEAKRRCASASRS